MKAILTVIGKDSVGIIAGISERLAALNVNILDVSQTIMNGYFTMIMVLDLSAADKSFSDLKHALTEKGEALHVTVMIQREEIFTSMHSL
ncbi:MAG: ACT domain-containing protein [Sporolactobacillus sp.]